MEVAQQPEDRSGNDSNNKKSRPNGTTPSRHPDTSLVQVSEKDKSSLVRCLDKSLQDISPTITTTNTSNPFLFGHTTAAQKTSATTEKLTNMATDSGHPARKHNNSMAAVDNLHPSLLRKLGPKGPCSWTTCSHTLLEVDYCRETGCTNPVHHLCQGAWECAPGGTELGPGILRCPVHHKHFQATRNENTKPASSLTSALYKTPRSTDTTWTPAPSEQKKLSFSSKISFSTDQTHGRTTTTTPSSKTSSLTSSTAGSGLPKKPTKTPHTHKYQFAVKVCLHVPNCSHFATKCTNLLAYGLEKL